MGCSFSGAKDCGAPRPDELPSDPVELEKLDSIRSRQEEQLEVASRSTRTLRTVDAPLVYPSSSSGRAREGSASGHEGSVDSSGVNFSQSSRLSAAHGSGKKWATTQTMNSQEHYADADQTIIIFDWDDTLCPSSSLRRFASFDKGGRLISQVEGQSKLEMNVLEEQVVPMLLLAQTLGTVVIVTNAKRPWVDTSCQAFLPNLKSHLKKIPIIYALELVKEGEAAVFNGGKNRLLTETKARAMKAAVTKFYSRYRDQSWKNIVSIGDALFEHDAIRQVTRERDGVQRKKCRTKTIKLLGNPSITGLTVQLSIVENWLRKVVQADYDVDIDMSADEETVNKWLREYGVDHL